jgi:hypothetical protein
MYIYIREFAVTLAHLLFDPLLLHALLLLLQLLLPAPPPQLV